MPTPRRQLHPTHDRNQAHRPGSQPLAGHRDKHDQDRDHRQTDRHTQDGHQGRGSAGRCRDLVRRQVRDLASRPLRREFRWNRSPPS